MKKTWKVFTLTKKREAIKDIRDLIAKGNSVTRARLLVGRTLGVTPNTIYNWERALTGRTTQSKGLRVTPSETSIIIPTNGATKPHITSVNLHVPGKGNITLDHELLSNISRLAGFVS